MSAPPAAAPPSTARVALLLGTLVALTIIGASAVAVALPAVAADLRLDTGGTAWVLAAFSLAFSVSTAVFGRLADLRGLRTPLWVGGLLFASGSLLAGAAWSFPALIAARLLQGAGGGAVPVLTLGVIAARFSDGARARVLGGLMAVVTVVSGSGPLIGGAIAQALGWRAVLALPAAAALLVAPVARLAPARPGATGERMDWAGAGLVAGLASGIVLLLQSPSTGAGPWAAAGFALVAAAGGGGLARHVRRRPDGFLPRAVVTNKAVVLACATGLTLLAAYFSMLLALPLLLARDQGWRPLQIGLAMLPAALLGAVASRVVGAAVGWVGRYRLTAALAAGSAAGLLLAAVASGSPGLLVAGMALVAIGFAGGQVTLIDEIPRLVDEDVRNVALGVFNLVFFTGGAIGSAAVGGLAGVLSLAGALAAVAALPLVGAVAVLAAGRAGGDRLGEGGRGAAAGGWGSTG